MSALAAGRVAKEYQPRTVVRSFGMAASTQIWEGGGVVLNSSGYAVPATTATGLKSVGCAQFSKLSGSVAGVDQIEVHIGTFLFNVDSPFTVTAIGSLCYFVDDQTVTLTSTGASEAGVVQQIDANGNAFVSLGLKLF